jgi:hypothetical protein
MNAKIVVYEPIILPVLLYECGACSLTLREEQRLRELQRIFGLKRNEVTGGWRKLNNEELHNFYSSPIIIRIMKSRRRRGWATHTTRMGRKGMHGGSWWEIQKEGDH